MTCVLGLGLDPKLVFYLATSMNKGFGKICNCSFEGAGFEWMPLEAVRDK